MSALPKIPLDSSQDLAFLRLQLQQSLSQRLQFHLPNALPEDHLRNLIESHISTFLSSTMQETSQNITINGLEPRPSDIAKGVQVESESYETFDVGLQQEVLKRHAELEETITRVTTMRRNVPQRIKAAHKSITIPELSTSGQAATEPMEDLKPVEIPRLDEVIQSYEDSVKLLKEMKGNVGAVNAKVQRAKEVLQYIQSEHATTGSSSQAN